MNNPHATNGQTADAPHGPDPRRARPHTVSASFHDTDAVQNALEQLIRAGVPRDLIDIVVSPEAARKFYPGSSQGPGNDALRFAGAGGLIGLVIGSVVSLILIMLPGFFDTGIIPYVQLIGPNFATASGALIGGGIGFFRKRRPNPHHARAAEEPGAIIVVVTLRSREEAQRVAQILAGAGGAEPRIQR
jgi:hypothetical protein